MYVYMRVYVCMCVLEVEEVYFKMKILEADDQEYEAVRRITSSPQYSLVGWMAGGNSFGGVGPFALWPRKSRVEGTQKGREVQEQEEVGKKDKGKEGEERKEGKEENEEERGEGGGCGGEEQLFP